MARPTLFKICFLIAALSCIGASTAYSATATSISGATVIGGGTFSPSNKVTIAVSVGPASCDPTGATTCQEYVAKSKHGAGDRQFATNNQDPKIYYKTVPVTTAAETPASSTETFGGTGWTSL